jgi:hypothetical protein
MCVLLCWRIAKLESGAYVVGGCRSSGDRAAVCCCGMPESSHGAWVGVCWGSRGQSVVVWCAHELTLVQSWQHHRSAMLPLPCMVASTQVLTVSSITRSYHRLITPPTTMQAWVKARKAADFSVFAPYLSQWVEISRQKAAYIDPTRPVYDVLLDDYEKGMTTERLDEIFAQVGACMHAGGWVHACMQAAAGAGAGVAVLQHCSVVVTFERLM